MTTYEKLVKKHGYIDTAKCGINEDGEDVIVSIDEESACVRTLQKNGWMRINIYYPDGTSEELFER